MTDFINLEAEQAIIGSCIMNNVNLARVADILEEKHFYFAEHRAIWRRFIEVSQEMVANEVTMKNFFASNEDILKVGGSKYLSVLLAQATAVIDIRDYAMMVFAFWQKREYMRILNESVESVKEGKFEAIIAKLENDLLSLESFSSEKKVKHISEIIDEIQEDEDRGFSEKYIPTGINALDKLLQGGLYHKELNIIGARPSIGKSSLGKQIIFNAAKKSEDQKHCLFFSIEESNRVVSKSFISFISMIAGWKIRRRIFNQAERAAYGVAKGALKEFTISIDDSSALTINQIRRKIKNHVSRNPLDLIVVDYVQIVKSEESRGKNQSLLVKEITTSLKALAKEYDIAILALAQIGRKGAESARQEPCVNDFKESGGIEEDADVAIIIHRDRLEGDESANNGGAKFSGSGKLIVAKNRQGSTGEVHVNFDGEMGFFSEQSGNLSF